MGVDGGYWNARRGELNYTEYFDTPLPTTEFILSVSKAIGLHARDVGVENFSYDSELRASHDTAMLLMGIQANSAAVN